jgi:hypothetical protein
MCLMVRSTMPTRSSSTRVETGYLGSTGLAADDGLAAQANGALGSRDQRRDRAIARAARKAIDGDLNEQLPLVVRQTHTQTYLNLNGVIGNRANALLGGELSSKARFSRTIVSTSGGRRTNRFRPRSMSRPSGTSCTTSLRRANFTARHVARKTRSPRSLRSATPVPIALRGSSVALNG